MVGAGDRLQDERKIGSSFDQLSGITGLRSYVSCHVSRRRHICEQHRERWEYGQGWSIETWRPTVGGKL